MSDYTFPLVSSALGTQSSSKTSKTDLSSTDFLNLYIAQLQSASLDSLFSSEGSDSSSSSLGSSSSSFFGSSSSLLSSIANSSGNSLASSPAMQLSIYSNLIGKDISAIDPKTGVTSSGTVNSVVLQNSVAMLDIGSGLVDPSNIIRAK